MYEAVQQRVLDYSRENPGLLIDRSRTVCLDVTNRSIDGYCYLFFGDAPYPLLVAKAARTEEGKRVFEIEHDTLGQLDSIGLNRERRSTPEPLGRWLEQDGTLVLLQSALPGTLMKNLPGRKLFGAARVEQTLEAVLDWWESFVRAYGTRAMVLEGEAYEELVLEPVARYARSYLLEETERALLERRFESERRLEGAALSMMPRHGDFCAANMVLQEDGIGVFDWEFPLEPQTPFFDLFFFFSSLRYPYPLYRGESDHFHSFREVFWGEHDLARLLRDRLVTLANRYEVERSWLADLFVLSLVQVANMKFRGLTDSHGLPEEPHGSTPTEGEKRSLWESFRDPDKNAPFARIERGAFSNLRHVARFGLPKF